MIRRQQLFFNLVLGTLIVTVVLLGNAAYSNTAGDTTQTSTLLKQADELTPQPGVSPIRRIERDDRNQHNNPGTRKDQRTIDGSGNNRVTESMGAAHTPLRRLVNPAYSDGIATLAGANRPNPRDVSNTVNAQSVDRPNVQRASDFIWQWGQFLDHDIDLTDGVDPAEHADIVIPLGDIYFDPTASGTEVMPFNRSIYAVDSGVNSARQQINEITGWIDASNVYGSDDLRAAALRSNDGTGRLKTSEGELMPFNLEGLANAGGADPTLFLAGDVRANEQIGLTAMHTLFVREHNRLAEEYAQAHPNADGEEIYQRARRFVGALMQKITYRDYLPLLLGKGALSPYRGYREQVDASITNVFSTAAYRYGHSALSPQLLRIDATGNETSAGHLPLRNAFFAPQLLQTEGSLESLLRGLAAQRQQSIDVFVIDDVRNFLFGAPGGGGFDLASLNIQRGRDHGLPDYNTVRTSLGLSAAQVFSDISSDPEIQARLGNAYSDISLIDVWVGGLAEDHLPGKMVGELLYTVMKLQFEALRDGDRFWYTRALSKRDVDRVNRTTLADIIRRNTDIGTEISDNVFIVGSARGRDKSR